MSFFGRAFFGGPFFASGIVDTAPQRKKKKKGKVIRYSDFESREEYARALQAAVIAPPMVISVPMDEDDDLILALLARVLH